MGQDANYHLDRNYLAKPLSYGALRLYQIGRMYCKPTTQIDDHFHVDWFELTLVNSGRGRIVTNGVACPVERGDIYLSFPCDVHRIETDKDDPLKFDFFSFSATDRAILAELQTIVETHHAAESRMFQDERIKALIQNAIWEFDTEKFGQTEVLTAIFSQILFYVIRKFRDTAAEQNFSTVKNAEAFCYRVMHYIDTHIYSMKHLSEVADRFGYSFGYLTTLFKQTTARSLSEYYHEKKFETARLLVTERRLKTGEIAELLGYSSVYAFSKAFRNWYGTSPREYAAVYDEEKRKEPAT